MITIIDSIKVHRVNVIVEIFSWNLPERVTSLYIEEVLKGVGLMLFFPEI